MTLTVAVDDTNDLFIGADGSLSLRSDLLAVLQNCEHAAKTMRGEMIYAVDEGLPNFDTVWSGSPNRLQFEAFLRSALEEVEGVIEVQDLTSEQVADVLTYRAVISTIYGIGSING